jgi:uncharacterized protein YceK
MKMILLAMALLLSGCSAITAANERRLPGNSFSGVTNNAATWYCLPGRLRDDLNGDNATAKYFLLPVTVPFLLIAGLVDFAASTATDVLIIPYTLSTDQQEPRCQIGDCSCGQWTSFDHSQGVRPRGANHDTRFNFIMSRPG